MKRTINTVILILTGFSINAQDILYVRCIDADNLEKIDTFSITSSLEKLEIVNQKNGVYQLINFKKGTSITLNSENYNELDYQRPDKRLELAMKHNGERILKSGDTIIIELLLKNELLNKRWIEEDLLFSKVDTANIITTPDTNPNFVNEQDFIKILSSKLHFPNYLIEEGVQGKVLISAIVEVDGKLSNVRILRSLDPQLDRIALRAMRNSELPKLTPGTKENIPVRSKIVFPVNFNLN